MPHNFAIEISRIRAVAARQFDLLKVGGLIPPSATPKTHHPMDEKPMKVLTLSIKRYFFDDILAGKKTHEYRDIRPNNAKKYYRLLNNDRLYIPFVDDNQIPDDDSLIYFKPVKYDAIKLLTGAYSGKRPWALVEVKDAEVVICTDEDGNDIYIEMPDGTRYVQSYIDYTLGEILGKDLNPQ